MLKTRAPFGQLVLTAVAAAVPVAAQSISQLRVGYTNYAPSQAIPIAIGHNATVLVFGPGIAAATGVNAAGKLNASFASKAATGVGVKVAFPIKRRPGCSRCRRDRVAGIHVRHVAEWHLAWRRRRRLGDGHSTREPCRGPMPELQLAGTALRRVRRRVLTSMSSPHDTLSMLRAQRAGDESVMDALFERLYTELREIAHRRLRSFRPGDTLTTTALVHEAYIKLVDQGRAEPQDRPHFLALASRAMRFVLLDHARARASAKRGAAAEAVPIDEIQIAADERAHDLLRLDDALDQLAALDPRLGEVVELRFFGGLAHEEIALATGRSVPTVKRDWARARAWLYREMGTPTEQ